MTRSTSAKAWTWSTVLTLDRVCCAASEDSFDLATSFSSSLSASAQTVSFSDAKGGRQTNQRETLVACRSRLVGQQDLDARILWPRCQPRQRYRVGVRTLAATRAMPVPICPGQRVKEGQQGSRRVSKGRRGSGKLTGTEHADRLDAMAHACDGRRGERSDEGGQHDGGKVATREDETKSISHSYMVTV